MLNPELQEKIDLKEYIDYRYNESLNEVELLNVDSKDTKEKRKNNIFDNELVYADIT